MRLGVCLAAVATLSLQLAAGVAHASIVYNIDQTITSANPTGNPAQTDTVLGTLTTDGTIGTIQSSDILSYSLELIDGLNAANDVDLTTGNSSVVEDEGSALSASATSLSFNFGGSGEFLIQANSPGAYSGYSYFCFSTGVYACYDGETISPQYITADGVVATGSAAPVGIQSLGPPPSVPEPATLPVFALGLAAAWVAKRHRTPEYHRYRQ